MPRMAPTSTPTDVPAQDHATAPTPAAVSSAATGGSGARTTPGPTPVSRGGRIGHALVAVGPGLVGSLHGRRGFAMNPLSIQPAKIHCPPARDDTLTRERLNSWLERASDGRLALIVAEAG